MSVSVRGLPLTTVHLIFTKLALHQHEHCSLNNDHLFVVEFGQIIVSNTHIYGQNIT